MVMTANSTSSPPLSSTSIRLPRIINPIIEATDSSQRTTFTHFRLSVKFMSVPPFTAGYFPAASGHIETYLLFYTAAAVPDIQN